jgi:CubicO group peptidase (beta-lactamase class C family)
MTAPPKKDSGGGGGVSTTMDYARFCQMLLTGGRLDGATILSRTTVSLIASDYLGAILERSYDAQGFRGKDVAVSFARWGNGSEKSHDGKFIQRKNVGRLPMDEPGYCLCEAV